MPKSSRVTYEQVSAICNATLARAEQPTYALIFKELGGGTHAVVKRFLDRWRDEIAAKQVVMLPSELQSSLGLWFAQASTLATNNANAAVELAWAELKQAESDNQIEQLRQKADLERALSTMAQLGHELSLKTLALNLVSSQLKDAAINLATANAAVKAESSKGAAQQKRIEDLASELKSERDRHSHELAMADERSRGTEKALLMRHHHEVDPLKREIERLKTVAEGALASSEASRQKASKLEIDLARNLGAASAIRALQGV